MLAPKIQGRILQALSVAAADRVLEVGSGNGYLAACLEPAGMPRRDPSIFIRNLPRPREPTCAPSRRASVEFETRDAFGAAPLGEYDVIAVTGSLPVYDARFETIACASAGACSRSSVEAPVMDAILVRRVDGAEWIRESLFETVVEPLINATAAQRFVF